MLTFYFLYLIRIGFNSLFVITREKDVIHDAKL